MDYVADVVEDTTIRTVRYRVSGLPDLTPEQTYHRKATIRPDVVIIHYISLNGSPWVADRVIVEGSRVLRTGKIGEFRHTAEYTLDARHSAGIWPVFGPSWIVEFVRDRSRTNRIA